MRRALLVAIAAAALTAPAPAHAADCLAYPGDEAPPQTIAAWMAYGATLRGVPGELPVMAALVESGVRNLPAGTAGDSLGYFQMRASIWNQGEYAGYPTNPPLQLDWFLDQALAVRAAKLVSDPGYGSTEARYGEWIADVERPAEEYRGRYQPQLLPARALIGVGCAPGLVIPPPAPPPDLTAPVARLSRARPLRRLRGITIIVRCPAETCAASARARISLPRAARVYRPSSRPRSVAAGTGGRLTLRFGPRLRSALARHRRRGRHVRAALTVTVADAVGNSASERRRVRLF